MAVVLTARPGDLILPWGPQGQGYFHNNSKILQPFPHTLSLTEYVMDFSKDLGTWDITKDQMQKKRIWWSSTKPDTEEI